MCKRRVGVVFGGRSEEHEVSCKSAAYVMKALDPDKYDCLYIGITKDGKWKTFDGPVEAVEEGLWTGYAEDFSIDKLLDQVDFVLPVLHGPYGEDGTIQGMLELLGIPYGGCGLLASALAMDKCLFKELLAAKGLPLCKYLSFCKREFEGEPALVLKNVEKELGFPCFVKPANMGSSVGISKVESRGELASAIRTALRYDTKVVAEEFVDAREIEVAVSGNYIIEATLPGEIISGGDFYDYNAKYLGGEQMSKLIIPAPLPDEKRRNLQKLAVETFKAIGGEGFGRVDFFLRRNDGHIYINEVNTIPGLTKRSMFPLLWEAQGKTPKEIIERIIDLGYERYHTKNRR